ncbi:FCD domain-containing protein [Tessaracoccus lacteus]|uniref:FCD domain-containing protein n=1 Tax=Tessaracoccus lacteus TaxID=3041766 RepID=UPI0034DB6C79
MPQRQRARRGSGPAWSRGGVRGTLQVHIPDDWEIAEVYRVRAGLERLALRELMSSPNRVDYASRLRRALPTDEPGRTFIGALDIDLALHEQLCRLSGNQTLVDSWKRLSSIATCISLRTNGPPIGGPAPADLASGCRTSLRSWWGRPATHSR